MMKILLPILSFLLITACTTSAATDGSKRTKGVDSAGNVVNVKKGKTSKRDKNVIIVQAKPKTITVKCDLPPQPSPLARPLPLDSPKKLIDRLTKKLSEWTSYGDKVEKNC